MGNVAVDDQAAYVISLGARTSVGATAASSAAAVRAGISLFSEHPHMIDTAGNPMIVARAPYLLEDTDIVDRVLDLAVPAIRETLDPFQDLFRQIPSLPVVVGLPSKRPGLPESFTGRIAEKLKTMTEEGYERSSVEIIQTGHSAGLMAVEAGWRAIRHGMEDFLLIGGLDSYLEPETLEWLEACEQLHSAGKFNNAWGFVPGEAAGFCLLASEKAVRRYRLKPLAQILASANAMEKNLIRTDTVCLGKGLTAAFAPVLASLPTPDTKIDEILCDMNGEPYRAEEFGFAALRVAERFTDPADFLAPADCWGDVGAASGPLFVCLAVAGWCKGYDKGPYALLWTSSENGERSATVLSKNTLRPV
jgi:3-oxoacyl-[acyl-carrier-protein] synthase-1